MKDVDKNANTKKLLKLYFCGAENKDKTVRQKLSIKCKTKGCFLQGV
jgi:hypothetical protein